MRLNIITEGQSEETFVRDVLAAYLGERGTYAVARSVETSRRRGIHRGGLQNYAKARNDIRRWLSQDTDALVTTMFDLYRLPASFPTAGITRSSTPYSQVQQLETAMAADISSGRFLPYIQLHEFEALLYSDVVAVDTELALIQGKSHLKELQAIRNTVSSPEEINDGASTSPSKRLVSLFPAYDKIAHATLIAVRIGIDTMRTTCPHFHQWLLRIEEWTPHRES